MSKWTIHAVVLNWHDTESTLECVRSVLSDRRVTHTWVVDNESNAALSSKLNDSRSSLIELRENRGFAAGVNAGIIRAIDAGADAVLVINNDATLTAGSLERMLHAMRSNPSLGLVGPSIVDQSTGERSYGNSLSRTCRVSNVTLPSNEPDFVTWACVLVRRTVLETVGLLDERYFMYWEDVDYSRRMRAAGWGASVVTDAELLHAVSSSHQRAGGVISMYSAEGLTLFARTGSPATFFWGLARVLSRYVRACVTLKFDQAKWVRLGVLVGFRPSSPVYVQMDEVRRTHTPPAPTSNEAPE